ncbi:MAG: hypothetical protein ACI35O_11245, partial [Bacillaceae bacterium]
MNKLNSKNNDTPLSDNQTPALEGKKTSKLFGMGAFKKKKNNLYPLSDNQTPALEGKKTSKL